MNDDNYTSKYKEAKDLNKDNKANQLLNFKYKLKACGRMSRKNSKVSFHLIKNHRKISLIIVKLSH